jgi:protein associated with RNAse G/E
MDSRPSGKKMQKIKIVSRKYDGSLRDEYETYLYAETDESLLLFSEPGISYWHGRKSAWFESPDGLIEIYFKRRWYNLWHICEQNSNVNLIYVNIAMPATFQAGRLEWTDLDIDYRVNPDNSVERLDEDEFEQNIVCKGCPPDLIAQVHAACREVEALLATRTYPFDHAQQVKLYRRIKEGRR